MRPEQEAAIRTALRIGEQRRLLLESLRLAVESGDRASSDAFIKGGIPEESHDKRLAALGDEERALRRQVEREQAEAPTLDRAAVQRIADVLLCLVLPLA